MEIKKNISANYLNNNSVQQTKRDIKASEFLNYFKLNTLNFFHFRRNNRLV